jgi:hypothetical protein
MSARLLTLPKPVAARAARPQAVPAGAPLAVALFNDSGDRPDFGSLAVSQALRRLLRRAGAVVRHAWYRGDWQQLSTDPTMSIVAASRDCADLHRVFAEVDAVVVDGGRSLCGGRGRHLLAILGAAQQRGLPTFLVNSVIDCLPDDEGRAILAALTDCVVPEEATAARLSAAGIPHRVVSDAIFAAEFLETPIHDLRRHLVLLGLDAHAVGNPAVRTLCAAWDGPVRDYAAGDGARALDWRHTVATLRTASAIVCGSHHATCAAMAAGVPFVRLDAAVLPYVGGPGRPDEYPAAAADQSLSLIERVAAACAESSWFSATGSACEHLLPLPTFARLVPGLAPYSTTAGVVTSMGDMLGAVRRTTPIGGSVLHAGAGDGRLVEALAASGFRAWGTDAAWRLAHPDRHRHSVGTPWALPFADHVFSAVVISAGWLDHLELDDLDLALAEVARVTGDTVVLEVSGRALRARRAVDGERRETWWEERLDLHGFRALLTPRPIAIGPQTLLVMQAAAPVCLACGRAHARSNAGHDHLAVTAAIVATAAARGSALRR